MPKVDSSLPLILDNNTILNPQSQNYCGFEITKSNSVATTMGVGVEVEVEVESSRFLAARLTPPKLALVERQRPRPQ